MNRATAERYSKMLPHPLERSKCVYRSIMEEAVYNRKRWAARKAVWVNWAIEGTLTVGYGVHPQ